MRDFATKWTAPPDWTAWLTAPGLEITTVVGLEQALVSGDLAAALADLAGGAEASGAYAVATGDPYALRLARDRALIVSSRPIACRVGWHPRGYAATPMSAGYHVFELAGSGLPGLLARATTLDLASASPSATIVFAGVAAILYRREGKARLHVERGLAPYLWRWLEVSVVAMGCAAEPQITMP
jgi:sarcosine oxidase gamma subunit